MKQASSEARHCQDVPSGTARVQWSKLVSVDRNHASGTSNSSFQAEQSVQVVVEKYVSNLGALHKSAARAPDSPFPGPGGYLLRAALGRRFRLVVECACGTLLSPFGVGNAVDKLCDSAPVPSFS